MAYQYPQFGAMQDMGPELDPIKSRQILADRALSQPAPIDPMSERQSIARQALGISPGRLSAPSDLGIATPSTQPPMLPVSAPKQVAKKSHVPGQDLANESLDTAKQSFAEGAAAIDEGTAKMGEAYKNHLAQTVALDAAEAERQKQQAAAKADAWAGVKEQQAAARSMTIDPKRMLGSGSTRIIAGIATALGAFGSAFTGGPNTASEIIESRISKDIDAQKANMSNASGAADRSLNEYGMLMRQFGDEDIAAQAAFLRTNQRYTDQIKLLMQQTDNEIQKSQLGKLLSDRLQAQSNAEQDFAVKLEQLNIAKRSNYLQQRGQDLDHNERMAANAAKAKESGARPTADMVGDIAGGKAALKMLDDLEKSWDENASKPYAIASQILPMTDASRYNDDKKRAVSFIGKGIEGGKMTDSDAERHAKSMPQAGDSKGTAKKKIDGLRKAITDAQEARITTAQQAGYDMSGVDMPIRKEPAE